MIDAFCEHGQCDSVKSRKQQRPGLFEGVGQRFIYSFFEQAPGSLSFSADGQNGRLSESIVDITQTHPGKLARERPAAAVAFFRSYKSGVAQSCHNPPDHNWIRIHGSGHQLGSHRLFALRQVQEYMQNPGESTVAFHALDAGSSPGLSQGFLAAFKREGPRPTHK